MLSLVLVLLSGEALAGRPFNGRPNNGRPNNGRPNNGLGPDSTVNSFIWGHEPTFDWVFGQPWTQASFTANANTWGMILCHEPDRVEMEYLFATGLGPTDVVDLPRDCNFNGVIDENERFLLRGNLNYAPSLRNGTFLQPGSENDRQRLSNVMQAVTNNARSVDNENQIIHNQLRVSSHFDKADSDIVEAFPYFRHTATNIYAVSKRCENTNAHDRWMNNSYLHGAYDAASSAGRDPDCGYQVDGSRVFRVFTNSARIRIGATGVPAGKNVFLRVSKGFEAGFRNPAGNTSSTTTGTVRHYIMTPGTQYPVTLSGQGLYNVTWAAQNDMMLPANTSPRPAEWANVRVSLTVESGNVSTSDLDIFNLRESVYYSRAGGMFSMNNVNPAYRTCQLVAQWLYLGPNLGWMLSHVTYDTTTGSYGTCKRPETGTLFSNVFQQNDYIWNRADSDLYRARSCSSTAPCTRTAMGPANYGGTADYTAYSSPNYSQGINVARSTPRNRILGEFSRSYFQDWSLDESANAVTSFLTDACARDQATPPFSPVVMATPCNVVVAPLSTP